MSGPAARNRSRLAEAHAAAASVAGRLALVLASGRGLGRVRVTYWAAELRRAAALLEQMLADGGE